MPSFLRHDGGHFAQFVWGRFQQDRLTVTAGYLAYVTLLSLVPMIAVVFGMMSAFPVFQSLKQAMEQFVYHNFVPTAGEMLKEYIDGFVANATNTTAVGIGALIVVALMLISAIDKNLNYIWRSTQSRPLAQAFAMYWMILTLGPVLIGPASPSPPIFSRCGCSGPRACSASAICCCAACRSCSRYSPSCWSIPWCPTARYG